jgi:very-short-patch-repair endonuclease
VFALAGAPTGIKQDLGLDAWRGDMRRENELKQLGWVVLHFSWDDVCRRPHVVVAAIRVVLAGRASLF